MSFNFIECEEKIKELWDETKSFEKSNILSKDREEYVFYDGPPFATGLPHYGHILSGTIKDTVTRFWYQMGYKVERRFGWDCHGLPVEYEIDKKLGISTREEVLKMGIKNYNQECRDIVLRYTNEWVDVVKRMGRWVDFKNGYRTMDTKFMESVWHIFSLLYKKDYVYRGYRVMPFSTACSTPVSNFESNQNYKNIQDPSIVVAFEMVEKIRGKKMHLLAWTTTPWTLPSNLGLAVKEEFEYAVFERNEKFYVMMENRIPEYFKDVTVIEKVPGSEFIGKKYVPLFSYFIEEKFHRVLKGDFISEESGTGIVQMAPGFGEDDYDTFVSSGIIKENELVPCPLDDKGCFTEEVPMFKGRYIKDCDREIIRMLGDKILSSKTVEHRYPFCWRSDTPLIYRLVPTWFIKVKNSVEDLLKHNEKITWIPEGVKYKHFHNWLSNARDWSVSRNRFWGTPIPLWVNKDYTKIVCISSIEELKTRMKKGGPTEINDIHRENIDNIVIEHEGEELTRVDEVFDCWFESGSMPYAQSHYPFSLKNLDSKFPADFIGEGIDQTRGWFYTMHVISTLLFDSPAFKNVIVNGIVLAEDGKKMSKRLKNYPDPMAVVSKYGADSLRTYLLSSPVVQAKNLKFSEKGVKGVFKDLLIPWFNSLNFLLECEIMKKKGIEKLRDSTPLDGWIRNRINFFAVTVEKKMKAYDLNILADALRFVDELSNYYIRMNRDDLKNGATSVLKDVLTQFSIVMASFTPFFSEFAFQVLSGKMNISGELKSTVEFDSVHFQPFVKTVPVEEHEFNHSKKLIEGIRTFREMKTITLKTPIKNVTVVTNFPEQTQKFTNVIKNECNLLDLTYEEESKHKFVTVIRPNFEAINQKYTAKDEIRERIQAIRLNPNIPEKDELLITKEIDAPNSKCFSDFSLIFDLTSDKEIENKKIAREAHAQIQRMRKKVGAKPIDRVLVKISDPTLTALILKEYKIEEGETDVKLIEEKVTIGKKEITVTLYK